MATTRPVADLHVHTTCSDGVLALDEVPTAAHNAGLEAVAITDHDRVHPALRAPVTVADDITLIRGVELRVDVEDGSVPGMCVDLLAYAVEPTPELDRELHRIGQNRVERGATIIERVETHLDIDLDLRPHAGIGRPHIARAIADHSEAPYDVDGAFEHLIGGDGPCFVPRELPSFERGRDLLSASAPVVGLAHPLRYPDPMAALGVASTLDAVERWYPYDRPVDATPVDRAVAAHDLLPTGGSDAHGDRLGVAGTPEAAYSRVRERLPAAAPPEG